MRKFVRAIALGLLLTSAGCSGGGSSSVARAPVADAKAATETATISFVVPVRSAGAHVRTPSYISPGTQSVVVQVSPGGSTTVNTPGPGPYSVNVPVSPGSTSFFVYALSGPNGTGSILSQGSASQTIVTGGNTVNVNLLGTISSIVASYTLTSAGPPQNWTAVLVARDAASNIISGTYFNPISITNSDLSGQTGLSTTTVSNSTTPVTLTYNQVGFSGACNYAILTASALGAAPAIITFAKGNKLVTNTNDSGAGSLRQAITGLAANDTIAINTVGTVNALSGYGSIATGNVNICGPGPAAFTVNGASGGTSGFVSIPAPTVGISGLTLANWSSTSFGGAIQLNSSASIINVAFVSNSATGGANGGAISASGGAGTIGITNSTFTGNTAAGGNGGAIFAASPFTVNISNSTFNANSAQRGGAIYNQVTTVNVMNSTITANAATVAGGGGYFNSSTGSNGLIAMDTFYNNTATFGGRNLDNGSGGGVVNIQQSVFGSSGGTQDLNGPMGSLGYSVIQNTAGATGLLGSDVNATPTLQALASNGAATATMKPLSANVIDIIPSGSCALLVDQRGFPRALDGFCDAGAYET